VPMKASGIPWLEEMPAHWAGAAIGKLASTIQTGPFGSQLHSYDYVVGGTPVINPSHLFNGRIHHSQKATISDAKLRELSRHRLAEGDIVIARRGDIGRCGLVTSTEDGWLCGTGSLKLQCNPHFMIPAYFQLAFASPSTSNALAAQSVGVTMLNLSAGTVARHRLAHPPIIEQEAIVRAVRLATRDLDATIERTQRQIGLLREYRARLVADVVTGKLDVRAFAETLPVEAPDDIEAIEADVDEDADDDETGDGADEG